MTAGPPLDQVSLHFDPVGSWPFVILVATALAAVLVLVPPDRTRVSGHRLLLLVLLRLAAFLALVGCMLRPTVVAEQKARQRGTILVLADASESMTVADGPGGRTRWQHMAESLAAAGPEARRLAESGDFELSVWTFDREVRTVPPVDGDPFSLGTWADVPAADETAIGAALDDSLRSIAGRALTGVILLSDGDQQAYAPRDLPPQTAARRVADTGAPLWCITFGQQRGGGQGRDAAVTNLDVTDSVYLENVVEVAGRIRLDGLAGRDARVVLLVEDGAGAMEEVARRDVRSEIDGSEQAVRLAWTPRTLGERKLTLRVEPQEGEVILANNELSTFVNVVDGGLRVLYLEGSLRVEQRFLRRVLSASPDIQVEFRWIDSSRRDRWPEDISRLLAGRSDVILIGDLDSSALRSDDLRAMLGKVNAGTGLGLLGGFHAFEAGGWAGTPLAPALPFAADRAARQGFDEPVRKDLHLEGPQRMLPDSRFGGVSILRLGKSDADSRAVWESLPPLDGASKIDRIVTTAKPLAVTPDGVPLLVAREYGEGRVLAFGGDSTWRWAMQGAAEQHRRFWRQFVLWLARKDDARDDALWVNPAQRRIAPGQPLEFDAGLTRPDGTAAPGVELEAAVVSPQGERRPIRVGRRGDTFAGVVADCAEPGDWRLVVQGKRPGDLAPREQAVRFTVFRQDLELANPRANPQRMRDLADLTVGGARQPEELPDIFRDFASRPAAFESREQWSFTPWDTWPAFLVLAGCLCAEWFFRKRFGLV